MDFLWLAVEPRCLRLEYFTQHIIYSFLSAGMVTLLQQVLQIYAAKALTLESSTEKVGAIRVLPLHLWLSGLPADIVIRQYKE